MKNFNNKLLLILQIMILIICPFINNYSQTDLFDQSGIAIEKRVPASSIPLSAKDFTEGLNNSGNVSLPIPLVNIGGISIGINYNSNNVSSKARVENKYEPTGAYGFGWDMNIGTISAEINNSADTSDDRYFYNGSDGNFEIKQDVSGEFRIPDFKPWKIERVVVNDKIVGWKIIKEDGTIYRYGNYLGNDTYSPANVSPYATRFNLGKNGLAVNPIQTDYSSVEQIPYQWDLSNVTYINGKNTTLLYNNEITNLLLNGTPTSLGYTRESNISEINDNQGSKVSFNFDTYIDPNVYFDDYPPYTQNRFITKYLKSIQISNNSNIFKIYEFNYLSGDVHNLGIVKSYLKEIKIIGLNDVELPSYRFEYYGLNGVSSGINPGAIESITDPNGGKFSYTYKTQTLPNVTLNSIQAVTSIDYWDEISYSGVSQVTWVPKSDGLAGNKFVGVSEEDHSLHIYRKNENNWYEDEDFPVTSVADIELSIYNDYITYYEGTNLKVSKIKDNGWQTFNVTAAIDAITNETVGLSSVIGTYSNYFIVKYNQIDVPNTAPPTSSWALAAVEFTNSGLQAYKLSDQSDDRYWNGGILNDGEKRQNINAYCGQNYFIVKSYDDVNRANVVFSHFKLNNSLNNHWQNLLDEGDNNLFPYGDNPTIQIGKNFIVLAGAGNIKVYRNGSNTLQVIESFTYESENGQNIALTDEYYAFEEYPGITIKTWNGSNFETSYYDGGYSWGNYNVQNVGDKLIIACTNITTSKSKIGYKQYLHSYVPSQNKWTDFIQIEEKDFNTPWGINIVGLNENEFAVMWTSNGDDDYGGGWQHDDTEINTFSFQGGNILKNIVDIIPLRPYSGNYENPSTWSIQPGSNFIAVSRPDWLGDISTPDSIHIYSFLHNNDGTMQFTGTPTVVVLHTKTIDDGMGNETEYVYNFNDGELNENNSAEYETVITNLPESNGTVEKTYDTSKDDIVGNINTKFLTGLTNNVKEKNIFTTNIKETQSNWTVEPIDIDNGVVFKKLNSETSTIDGVANSISYEYSGTPYYQLTKKTETNSDNTVRNTEIRYAYQENASMKTSNILSPIYSTTIKIGTNDVEAKNWSIWSNTDGNWRPREEDVWKGDGTTNDQTADEDPSASESFTLNTYNAYDNVGNILSETDANGVISKYLYADGKSNLILKATNTGTGNIVADNFNDNSFSDSDPFTWTTSSGWSVSDGELQSPLNSISYARIQNYQFQSFKADVQAKINNNGGLTTYWVGILFGTTSTAYTTGGYLVYYRDNGYLALYQNGVNLAYVNTYLLPNKKRKISVSVEGNNIKVFIDGTEFINETASTTIATGYVSLYSYKTQSSFDNFRVYPIGAIAQSFAYDPITGNITEVNDENNNSTYYGYDDNGRIDNVSYLYYGIKKLVAARDYFLSRDTYTNFNPTYPNKITSYLYNDDYYYTQNINFLDGLNRPIQEKLALDNNVIVSKNIEYDIFGNVVKNYKPYLLSGTNYNYDPNYLTNSNNYYTGGLGAYDNYCATNGRPYYEMKYFDDPLHRTDEETPEGTSWASHKISHDYAGNESNYIQYATGTYYTQNSLYKNILTNENGIINWNYTDKFNNLILTVENPTGLNLKTQFKYDILGNQIEKKDPSSLIINYKYNPIKQLIEQTSPDAGTTRYLYDKNGNIRFKRHADQITTSNNTYRSSSYMYSPTTVTGTFSLVTPTMLKVRALATSTGFYATTTVKIKNSDGLYQFLEVKAESNGNTDVTKYIRLPKGSYKWETITAGSGPITFFYDVDTRYNMEFEYNKYDELNRIVENGEHYYYYSNSDAFTQTNANNRDFPTSGQHLNKKYIYDEETTDVIAVIQRNVYGKLSYSYSYHMNSLAFTTYYSYNDLGEIEWIINKWVDGKYNTIKYKYDLQKRITQIDFLGDQSIYNYYKFFEYDDIGRLLNVYTADNSSGIDKEKVAEYEYFADGTVKRLELGPEGDKVQGVDYQYNERGWIAQINHQNLTSTDDPGGDGTNGLPLDKYGMVIGYNNVSGNIASAQNATAQWNGNISWLMYKMYGVTTGGSLVGNTYTYDNVNRLKKSDFGYNSGSWISTNRFDVTNINYDNNGDITAINRYNKDSQLFDIQTFNYFSGGNKLKYIYDIGNSSYSSTDIDMQVENNYEYDDMGNMIKDTQQGIGLILYDLQNLPVRIYKNNNVFEYIYDANGNRVSKIESGNTVWNYAYGANGKTEARIQDSQDLIKHNLWGNDLLGITESISSSTDEKYYFLKDHLGSIKMRLFEDGTVAGYDDYYPFGMILNGRSSSTGSTEEYKFTGKERDTETGLDYFGARQYDSKIGRWLSVDPLADKYPGWSPYHYCLNNPIRGVDPDGRGFWDIVSGVSNSLSDNNTMGLTKARANANYENSSHGRIGEQIGNVLSLVQSGAEFLTGGTMVGGGGALTIGGAATGPGELVLAPAGIATTAAGVAVIADAIGVGAVALNNMMEGNNGGGYDQPASRNEQGRPQADPEAQGPHSTLSTRNGEKQGHTFNKEGQLESEVSPFDKRHGPHEHKYNNSDPQNPVRGKWEPLKKDN